MTALTLPVLGAKRRGFRCLNALPVLAFLGCASFALQGCASARMSDRESDNLFREGKYAEAAEHLKEGLKKEGSKGADRLLYLFDLGLALHSAGRYEESNQILLEAEQIADIRDYTSLAAEGATLLVSENIKDYKGEDFEKVIVNVYLAMNYALLGNLEDALVEARKVNQKLYLMVSQGKRKYKQNAFARYLSAILYEMQGDDNDAYVDYKKTHDLMPQFPGLGQDLWRTANTLHIEEDLDRWDKEYDLSDEDHRVARLKGRKSREGEIVILYENGISPVKVPNPNYAAIPKFKPRNNPVTHAEISVDGQPIAQTHLLHDIESTAIENLDEKYAAIIAKKIAGGITKLVIANQIERQTNSELLGALTRVVLFAADQADLRSWNLLPKELQMARFTLPPGKHRIQITPVGDSTRSKDWDIVVQSGRKNLICFRYMP